MIIKESPQLLIIDTKNEENDPEALVKLMELHTDGVKIIFTGHEMTMIQGQTKGNGAEVVKLLELHFNSKDLVEQVGQFLDSPFTLPATDELLSCDVIEHDENYPSHVHELASHLTGLIALIHSSAKEMKNALQNETPTKEGIEHWNDELVEEIRKLWENAKT